MTEKPEKVQPRFAPGNHYTSSGLAIDQEARAWWVDIETKTITLAVVQEPDES